MERFAGVCGAGLSHSIVAKPAYPPWPHSACPPEGLAGGCAPCDPPKRQRRHEGRTHRRNLIATDAVVPAVDRPTDWPTGRWGPPICPPSFRAAANPVLSWRRTRQPTGLRAEHGGSAGHGVQFVGVALDGARPLRLRPLWSVKTTRGVVSRLCGPGIHTAADAYPPRPERPAAVRLARPLPDGPHRPWRERPPTPRAWCGIAPSVFSHPRPCLPGVAPEPAIRAGRRFNAASRRRRAHSPTAGS